MRHTDAMPGETFPMPMDSQQDEASYSDEQTDLIIEMYCEEGLDESYEDRKLKRRESDAKCRANISAGFDVLKEQVYASGSQDKVSKESILHQSFVRIKYLEGVLVALQQTKEVLNGKEEHLKDASPLHQVRSIHRQFVASQQRKWGRRRSPTQRPIQDAPIHPKERQDGIKRMAKKRRPPNLKPFKISPPIKRKKCSPIIQLPPALHTPSRPQKRIKLASTEPNQDQVVPLSSILNPNVKMPLSTSTKKGAGLSRAGSQRVPHSPQIVRNFYGTNEGIQQENDYINEAGAPSSPLVDVCTTPRKSSLLRGSSVISTPMKTYQIIGTSITPVKMDYHVGSQTVLKVPKFQASPDLVCDEEPTSWPEDDSSSSSGSIPELHISHPWFSTPVRPTCTSLLIGDQPPVLPGKQQRLSSRPPVLEPQVEIGESRRKKLFKRSSGAILKPKRTTPRKKYRKRATAARVRAWDSATGRVLSPVQPYSGVFKSIQQRKLDASKKRKPPAVDTCGPTEYLGHKLPDSDFDAPTVHPIHSTIRERLVGQLDSDIVYISGYREDSDQEIIDLSVPDSEEIKPISRDNVVPAMCMDDHSNNSSPTCLRDVSLPPPAGTISPPSIALHDESPELFKGFRSIWLKNTKPDNSVAWDVRPEDSDHYIDHEEGFYDYHLKARCDLDDAGSPVQEEDLFEADLGDMRHLDPALQPPSSSLEGEDYIIHPHGNKMDQLERISLVADVNESTVSRHAKHSQISSDVLITPALASFATSALSLKHSQRTIRKGQRRRRNVRLNLPKVSPASEDEDDDLNIWKFTQAALNERDVLRFLPTDNSYPLITNNHF